MSPPSALRGPTRERARLPNFLHDATTSESYEMCAAIAHMRPISAAICHSPLAPLPSLSLPQCPGRAGQKVYNRAVLPAVCSSCLNNGRFNAHHCPTRRRTSVCLHIYVRVLVVLPALSILAGFCLLFEIFFCPSFGLFRWASPKSVDLRDSLSVLRGRILC